MFVRSWRGLQWSIVLVKAPATVSQLFIDGRVAWPTIPMPEIFQPQNVRKTHTTAHKSAALLRRDFDLRMNLGCSR